MSEQTQQGVALTRTYRVTHGIIRCILKLLPVRYLHAERIQGSRPCILISNHLCFMDPFLASVPVRREAIAWLGKKELVKLPIMERYLKAMQMIVVDRHNTDMQAMRSCMKVLKNGGILGVFPEGTRHHEGIMEHLESGIAMIALRSKAPIIPLYISGKPSPFRRTVCVFGEPIVLDDLIAGGISKENCELVLQRIRDAYPPMIAEAEAARKSRK